jgi:peptidase C10-like protein/Spi protease inhibitor/type IX secretion system substrate protein
MNRVVAAIILVVVAGSALLAIEQDINRAEVIASNFLSYKSSEASISGTHTLTSERAELVYIFELEPDGFIAMSADSDVYPVLAYSFRNKLSGSNNLLLDILEEDVNKRLAYNKINISRKLENNRIWDQFYTGVQTRTDFEQWPAGEAAGTDGWVETTWNQSGVYNQFCPVDNGGERSVVGCTATAMAMIMDFHRYIGTASFNDSDDYYTWSEGMHIDNDHEDRDYPSFPELNEYLEDLILHYQAEIPITDTDKAALSFAAGVAVEMNYSSTGSGAWGVAGPLMYKFGYDNAEEVEYEDYDFFSRMQENMMMMRPIEIAIYTANYSAGHAIIVDGYNTDDYYHLNYGWGTSNNTCWYLLPEGMPAGYAIIMSAILDIEGGTVPVEVSGSVTTDGVSPTGTEIFLEGERYSYHFTIDEEAGSFIFPAVLEGNYSATAYLNDRIHYQHLENIYIDEDNNTIQFQLGNFDSVTGNITAPVNVQNCQIVLYQDDLPIYVGVTAAGGSFSIPDVLPGVYSVTASMAGNYFAQQEIEISLDNQIFDLELQHYEGELALTYASYPVETWSFIPNYALGCAIKVTADVSLGQEDDILSQIRFKCPISEEEGEIMVQIWEGDLMLSEKEITGFVQGEWITCDLENYILMDPVKEYYAGYTITSESGTIAYRDNGPRVLGKGAFVRYSDWVELQPDNFDFNFCIEAVTGSQNYGMISGNVQLSGGSGNIYDVYLRANDFIAHPNADGNYQLPVKYGNYELLAALSGYSEGSIPGIIIDEANLILEDQDIELQYGVPAGDEIPEHIISLQNYPNPFNPSTTISFSSNFKFTEDTELNIYNMKGQKIKTFSFQDGITATGSSCSISWNGTDENDQAVPSGIYFYRLKTADRELTRKMALVK